MNKKILIVSNNSLNIIGSNGKTLESFFKNFSQFSISQLYFNDEIPNSRICNHFYRVTEKDIVNKLLKKDIACGKEMNSSCQNNINKKDVKKRHIPKNNATRLCRELLWQSNLWRTPQLKDWVLDFQPDLIFFCAGDSGFAYDIVFYIQKITQAKLVIYITDDYILSRINISPLFWIRRNNILKKMQKIIDMSDGFMTISELMRKKYLEIFHKDSFVASNMSESLKLSNQIKNQNDTINIVYTGGLHYGRDKVLAMVGKALLKYNQNKTHKKAILKIYTPSKPSAASLKMINIPNASVYCGCLNQEQLKNVLNSCDFPLHVESFEQKNIYKTRLSVSTKITEYLSLGKCILAIGPIEVASLNLLNDYAYCINDLKDLANRLTIILEDKRLSSEYAEKSLKAFEVKYDSAIVRDNFEKFINEIFI